MGVGWVEPGHDDDAGEPQVHAEPDAAFHRASAVVAEQPELLVFDHDVGRRVFHGRRGQVYQAYRAGQEQQYSSAPSGSRILHACYREAEPAPSATDRASPRACGVVG